MIKLLLLLITILLVVLLLYFSTRKKPGENFTNTDWKDLSLSESNRMWNKLVKDVYVINLEKDSGRKIYMESLLNSLSINYQFWKGFDARTRGIQNFCIPMFNKSTVGEVGCAISHTKLLEKIAKDVDNDYTLDNKWFIIFEDDIVPTIQNPVRLKSMIVNALNNIPKEYDLVLLGSCFDEYSDDSIRINDYTWDIKSLCLHSYAVRGRSAGKIGSVLNSKLCDMPIDVMTRDSVDMKRATVFRRKYNPANSLNQFNSDCDKDYFCQGLFAQKKDNTDFKTNILKNSIFPEEVLASQRDIYGEY